MNLTLEYAKHTLDITSEFQLGAEAVVRFEGSPHVVGDTVADHLARCFRLAAYLMPYLLEECAQGDEREGFEAGLYTALLFHDDDEIVIGYDIPTPLKTHNIKDDQEVEDLRQRLADLNEAQRAYVLKPFQQFRARDTVLAKVAKVIDRVTANQVVVEQVIGVLAPDNARFAIEYINGDMVRGASETTDILLDAQTQQIYDVREKYSQDKQLRVDLAEKIVQNPQCSKSTDELEQIMVRLLDVDLNSYTWSKDRINTPLWEL